MKYLLVLLFFSKAFALSLTDDTLFALQQLETLIPERLWEQEFSIRIDEKAFQKAAQKWMDHPRKEKRIQFCFSIGDPKDYFLFSTMSGETIRIFDRYEEFEEGVFWRTPKMMDRLNWLEE